MTRHPDLPDDDEAAAINADFAAGRIDYTGFFNDAGEPAPWPDDLDHWQPEKGEPVTIKPGEPPF
jgi:hypothetical protein